MDLGFEGGFRVHRKSIPFIEIAKSNLDSWVDLPRSDFEIVFANDILKEAQAAYVPFFSSRGSNHIFRTESIVDLVKEAESGKSVFPKADVVIGGFPCQDFSLAGKRLGLESHKSHRGKVDPGSPTSESRGQLYMWMKRVVELTRPKVFVAENVKGLVSLGDVKRIIESDFRSVDLGYVVVEAKVLHAGNFGVPQNRERVIFIGFSRRYLAEGIEEKLMSGEIDPYPTITHNLPGQFSVNLAPWVTVGDVLGDLPEPVNAVDPDQIAFSKAKYYGSHVQGQAEVKLEGLGPTIRAEHHGNIEFRRLPLSLGGRYASELALGAIPRRLTVRECARIQTFPDSYRFIRKPTEILGLPGLSASGAYKVIGNAVPPLLGYRIADRLNQVWTQVFGDNT